ncbi:uncharacterized protein LOC142333324 [Lycorma delicatula]|uniref:uncharacterized protein LOC142333154 n=1 Tax=Lycorma delicatula TaxID=130591 RepID=UPI003F5137C1
MVFFIVHLMYVAVCLKSLEDITKTSEVIFDGTYNEFKYHITEDRKKLMKLISKELVTTNNILYYSIKLYCYISCSWTLIFTFFIVMTANDLNTIKIENLPLPYPVYYFSNYNNFYIYSFWYILQSVYIWLLCNLTYLAYCATFISMKIISKDIKLLSFSVNEMEYIISMNVKSKINPQIIYKYGNEFTENESILVKGILICIIKHHQLIYRKLKIIDKAIQGISMALKCGACSYTCMSVYMMVQKDDIVFKLIETQLCIQIFYLMYIYDSSGEEINTEWENLRDSIYECNWINKPEWFKKMLLIMMTRNNRPIEVKPYGLFVLNLRNFSASINASYSFYNVLNNTKMK